MMRDFIIFKLYLLVFICYSIGCVYHNNHEPQKRKQQCVLKHTGYAAGKWSQNKKQCSTAGNRHKPIDCEISLKEFVNEIKDDNIKVYIIDVREPMEIEMDGKIPRSHLLPLGQVKAALQIPDDQFYKKYGFEKPPDDGYRVVFYCYAGVRSLEATLIARSLGCTQARSLTGGIAAWNEYQQSIS